MTRFASLSLAVLVATSVYTLAANTPQEERNKATVLEFYEAALNRKDFDAASKHLGSRYVQHNPRVGDGAEGLRKFLEFRRARTPNATNEIKRVIVDGDVVVLHVHGRSEPSERGVAIIDIFRLEAGKIVEHWDAVQPIPETAAHGNGMF